MRERVKEGRKKRYKMGLLWIACCRQCSLAMLRETGVFSITKPAYSAGFKTLETY